MDRDEHLVGGDGRTRRVLIADHLWAAVAVNADCFHDLLLLFQRKDVQSIPTCRRSPNGGVSSLCNLPQCKRFVTCWKTAHVALPCKQTLHRSVEEPRWRS